MSEQLKSYKMVDESYSCGPFCPEPADVYLKSEVDKLIADLNMRICDGDEDFEIANNQIKRLIKLVRHQKYKRCLAMAEWCDTEVGIADTDGDYEDMQWYQKWYKRWLELAKNFTHSNSTAQ